MTFGVSAVELDRLPGQLRAAGDGIGQFEPVDTVAAGLVQAGSQPPVDTGALAASVTVTAGVISSTLPYAAPVHWGWTRGDAVVAGRPWLIQAADTTSDAVVDVYRDHVVDQLNTIN